MKTQSVYRDEMGGVDAHEKAGRADTVLKELRGEEDFEPV